MAREKTKRMGRPPSREGEFKEVRSIRIPPPLWAQVEKFCGSEGCSAFVRDAIEAKVKKMTVAKAS